MSSTKKILKRLAKLHPKIIDLSLDRVKKLLEKLGNPHLIIPPAIHIAGTNGKGSTLAFIKAGLEANEKIVHSYTSPHLVDFSERIGLRGEKIDETLLIHYLEACEKINLNNNITFFEITTCAAFLAFSESKADYTLLEVGLGGRLDATNVIESPILSIITPISLDHQQFLGNSILEITAEKAGILKPSVPAIIGRQSSEVEEKLRSIAEGIGTSLILSGSDWVVKQFKNSLIYEDNDGIIELPTPSLTGSHQFENAGVAITALKFLNKNNGCLAESMQNVNWPARLQQLKHGPLISEIKKLAFTAELWIDGGHNQAAAKAITSFLKQNFDGSYHIIIGMIISKDVNNFISQLAAFVGSITCITIPNEPSSIDKKDIFKAATKCHPRTFMADSPFIAVKQIINMNNEEKNIRILICGSLYLCGYILNDHS